MTSVPTATSFCQLYVPVHYSRNDTDQSIVQNRLNNAVYDKTCTTTRTSK